MCHVGLRCANPTYASLASSALAAPGQDNARLGAGFFLVQHWRWACRVPGSFPEMGERLATVAPAQAGAQAMGWRWMHWIPACAGTTNKFTRRDSNHDRNMSQRDPRNPLRHLPDCNPPASGPTLPRWCATRQRRTQIGSRCAAARAPGQGVPEQRGYAARLLAQPDQGGPARWLGQRSGYDAGRLQWHRYGLAGNCCRRYPRPFPIQRFLAARAMPSGASCGRASVRRKLLGQRNAFANSLMSINLVQRQNGAKPVAIEYSQRLLPNPI